MFNPFMFRRQCAAGLVPYIIRPGDTLTRIAGDYNTTVQEIINANPGVSPNFLQVGQQICVPLKLQIYPACPTKNYYVVRPGDTFNSIADYFNVSYQQLLYSNYGINPDDLYVDQVLCIPVAPSPVSVVVDVSAKRLTVIRQGKVYRSYGIASENPNTPIPRGIFSVIYKNVDPGIERGARWIGLNEAEFGIRGTNNPQFIKELSSGKSIVLSNRDVSELFNLVPVGTSVRVQ